MPSKQPHWDIYNEEMSQFDSGHALWEPSPLKSFKRIQLGDVGYIRTGCFHRLFSAGCQLGERKLGTDVPLGFKPLDVGEIVEREPLEAGYLCTNGVRVTQVDPAPPPSPPLTSPTSRSQSSSSPSMLEPASSVSFQLTEGRGAALVTKYSTYREDVHRAGAFEKYAKEHYASWVAFARETGHGDVKPILITGVDRTRDFAMLCYSNDDDDLRCKFTTSAPGITAGWGKWQKRGLVYTNHGPQLRRPPSPTQTVESMSSGNGCTGTIVDEDEYNQCVFVRYFTVRKRLGVPRVIKAAAGPHDPGKRGQDGEESPLQAQYDSDSDTDVALSLLDDDRDDGWSSTTSIDSESDESDIVIHNPTADGRDDFDVIADYIFQNSSAESVLLHHRDITLLREPGVNTNLSIQLFEKRPPIMVDNNGVGTIGHQTELSGNTRSNMPLEVASTDLLSIPSKTGPGVNRIDGGQPDGHFLPHQRPEGDKILGKASQMLGGVRGFLRNLTSPIFRALYGGTVPRSGAEDPAQLSPDQLGQMPEIARGLPTVPDASNEPYVKPIPLLRQYLPDNCKWLEEGEIEVVGDIPISAGEFADIFVGMKEDRKVAIKSYRTYTSSDPLPISMQRFRSEAMAYRLLRCDGVVPFIGLYSTPKHPMCLVFEYMDHLSLDGYLLENMHARRCELLLEIARAVRYLHDVGVIHKNIKTSNVLVDINGHARLGGLGTAFLPSTTLGIETNSFYYGAAPELVKHQHLGLSDEGTTKATDVFAFAVLAYETFSGQVPFSHMSMIAGLASMQKGCRPARPRHPELSDRVWEAIERCWRDNPARRMAMAEVVALLEEEVGLPVKV